MVYQSEESRIISKRPDLCSYISSNFPAPSQSALRLLPTNILSFGPLYELLEGFKTDLEFHETDFVDDLQTFPIANEHALETYSARVAGTVAEMCLELVFYHSNAKLSQVEQEQIVRSGGQMGIALQYVNIARDISRDAAIGRVYIPTNWLEMKGLEPQNVIDKPDSAAVTKLRGRLLDKAFKKYEAAKGALAQLPPDSRAPMRVAVESYMEIGRVLREDRYQVKEGKATVPKFRRFKVAWNALY